MRLPPFSILVAVVLSAFMAPAVRAQTDPTHADVAYVMDFHPETPSGTGLLPTAQTEAAIAIQHAKLAAEAESNLEDVRLHVEHILHAIDPALAVEGPGLGFGVRRAATLAADLVAGMEADSTASENVRTHARYAAASFMSGLARTESIVALAQRILRSGSVGTAMPLLVQLNEECAALVHGRDLDRDGRVGWQRGEGGLRQAEWHLRLLQRGEGMTR